MRKIRDTAQPHLYVGVLLLTILVVEQHVLYVVCVFCRWVPTDCNRCFIDGLKTKRLWWTR